MPDSSRHGDPGGRRSATSEERRRMARQSPAIFARAPARALPACRARASWGATRSGRNALRARRASGAGGRSERSLGGRRRRVRALPFGVGMRAARVGSQPAHGVGQRLSPGARRIAELVRKQRRQAPEAGRHFQHDRVGHRRVQPPERNRTLRNLTISAARLAAPCPRARSRRRERRCRTGTSRWRARGRRSARR